jgi:hypothetical protein
VVRGEAGTGERRDFTLRRDFPSFLTKFEFSPYNSDIY